MSNASFQMNGVEVFSENAQVVTTGAGFPAGHVINHNFTTYSPSAGSASVPTSETYYFQTSITPASSSNFIYCLCVVNGQDNAGAGRLTTLVKYSTTSGSGGTNTQLGSNAIGSDNDTPTSNMYSGTILNRVTGLAAGTTYYFKLFARKDDGANTNSAYINRYVEANPSSIYVWEVQG